MIGILPSVPSQITDEPKSATASEGSMVVLRCRAVGSPQSTITWALNGKNIPIVKGNQTVN